LVRREQLGDVVGQLFGRRRLTARHDPRDNPLAEVVVRFAGDGRLRDAGVFEQRVFDLARADLVAAALDQVGRLAPDDLDVAVAVTRRHVAGAEPAVVERGRGRVRTVEV